MEEVLKLESSSTVICRPKINRPNGYSYGHSRYGTVSGLRKVTGCKACPIRMHILVTSNPAIAVILFLFFFTSQP